MIETRNGQSHSEREQTKPKGRFTGQRLLRGRPRIYRRVVELLAEPGVSINQITKHCRVSEHSVRAVRDREGVSIAERKQRLMSIFGNVAEIAGERMEELAGQATLRDAGITAGIATDRLLALLGEAGGGVPVNINLQVNAQLLHQRYAELVKRIEEETGAESKEALPDAEAFSDPPPQWICRAGKKTCKNSRSRRTMKAWSRTLADVVGRGQISVDLFSLPFSLGQFSS